MRRGGGINSEDYRPPLPPFDTALDISFDSAWFVERLLDFLPHTQGICPFTSGMYKAALRGLLPVIEKYLDFSIPGLEFLDIPELIER